MSNYLSMIDAALDRNDTPGAARIAEKAFEAGAREAILFNLVAWLREEEGQLDEAEDLLLSALEREPKDPTLHVGLGTVRRKQGRLQLAVSAFEQAIRLDQTWATPWVERGQTFEKGGAITDAGKDYEQAVQLEPDNVSALAHLASIHARQGRADLATGLANRALELEPGNLLAVNALALVALEAKDFAKAVDLLEPVVARGEGPQDTLVNTTTLLGDALEGCERFDDAFAAYGKAQQAFHAFHSRRLPADAESAMQYLARVKASLETAGIDAAAWPERRGTDGPAVARHVFLTGYPRSGTTLTENILASLPNALAIEERPTLARADREILARPDGVAALGAMKPHDLEPYRRDYWLRAERAAEQALAGTMFVDMDPFKGPRLPVITRLFPDAKIIITRRDPRDVVWSCFHTNFAMNAGTMCFTTLEDTARHYAESWSIVERSLERFQPDWFELRYEALVGNFDETTRALCAFLGVEWVEDLRAFDRTAQRRGVSTASATQVRRGLYDGSGGWRRYEKQLKSVEPILAPWIEKFGYA